MKKLIMGVLLSVCSLTLNAQVVEPYGGGEVSENAVMDKIDLKEIGRLVHVASVEDGQVMVRRFYRGKWELIGETPLKGIDKLQHIELFAYRATPYLFCQYDDKLSVIRSIDDKWEFVGKQTFGEGTIVNPEFSVIGETPYIVYEDTDYEMIRMVSLLNGLWYDQDLISTEKATSYKIAAKARGDLFITLLTNEGIEIKEVNMSEDFVTWIPAAKAYKVENVKAIDDFDFVENDGYVTYLDKNGHITILKLLDLEKKWEELEKAESKIDIGRQFYNLSVSEYFFFTGLSDAGVPQFLKNNKRGNWGDVTALSTKKAKCIASDDYKNVIYVAYVDAPTGKLMVKKIEKGLNDGEESQTGKKK